MMLAFMERFGTQAADVDNTPIHGKIADVTNSLPFFWAHAVFSLVFGVLILAILVAVLRLLWKKGSRK